MNDYIPPAPVIHTETYTKVIVPVSDQDTTTEPKVVLSTTNAAALMTAGIEASRKTERKQSMHNYIRTDKHQHIYTALAHKRVYGSNQIIISRKCSCSKQVAIDCGSKDAMREVYARLYNAQ